MAATTSGGLLGGTVSPSSVADTACAASGECGAKSPVRRRQAIRGGIISIIYIIVSISIIIIYVVVVIIISISIIIIYVVIVIIFIFKFISLFYHHSHHHDKFDLRFLTKENEWTYFSVFSLNISKGLIRMRSLLHDILRFNDGNWNDYKSLEVTS